MKNGEELGSHEATSFRERDLLIGEESPHRARGSSEFFQVPEPIYREGESSKNEKFRRKNVMKEL
mgnify:CR=1 FL=1